MPPLTVLHPFKTEALQHLRHALGDFGAGHARFLDQRKSDIVKDGHRVEQRAGLKQHPKLLPHPIQTARTEPGYVIAVDDYLAGIRTEQQA
jgi:hypothetical protein